MTNRDLVRLINEKAGFVGSDDYEQTCYWEMSDLLYSENGAKWRKYFDTQKGCYILIVKHSSFNKIIEVSYTVDKLSQDVNILNSNITLN